MSRLGKIVETLIGSAVMILLLPLIIGFLILALVINLIMVVLFGVSIDEYTVWSRRGDVSE